jgi:hypothetical protein
MYVMQVSTHHAESCPMFNKDVQKTMGGLLQQLDPLLEKHGIKLAGSWTDLGAHTIYNFYETASLDEYWRFLNEPTMTPWLTFNTVENRVVQSMDEIRAMMPGS